MDLQGKSLMRVEQFDEQRESRSASRVEDSPWRARTVGQRAEDRLSILRPKVVQGLAAERAMANDALGFGAIDNFPGLADAHNIRQFFSEVRFKTASAPNSFHEDGLEGEGTGELDGHFAENVQRPTLNVQRSILEKC